MEIQEITFNAEITKNHYLKMWKAKRETINMFQNNDNEEAYLERFISNSQVIEQKQ